VKLRLLYTVHFPLPSVSQALKQLYQPCIGTTLRNKFKPEPKVCSKLLLPSVTQYYKFTANIYLLQCITTTSFTSQSYFHLEKSSRVHRGAHKSNMLF